MNRHFIIPFFISHQGCPHRCTFCNQHVITGRQTSPALDASRILNEVRERLVEPRHRKRLVTQVAFYGGSFTGLPVERQRKLLGAVQPFLDDGRVDGIRISTRPDYIDPQIVSFLKNQGVKTVELGVQSMNDEVLAASGRGHTSLDTEKAIGCLRAEGMEVGVQLMVGLPGDRPVLAFAGAERLAALKPDIARIYAALVLEGSVLADEYRNGSYRPLCLVRAVAISGRLREIFEERGVKVIRVGLQETEGLAAEIIAGPYHPAFGEMVLVRNLYRRVHKTLAGKKKPGSVKLHLSAADQSVFRGAGNSNFKRLERKGLLSDVEVVFEENCSRGNVRVS